MPSRGGVRDRCLGTVRPIGGGDRRALGVRVSSERPDEQVVGVSIAASTRAPRSPLALFAGPLAHHLLVGPAARVWAAGLAVGRARVSCPVEIVISTVTAAVTRARTASWAARRIGYQRRSPP